MKKMMLSLVVAAFFLGLSTETTFAEKQVVEMLYGDRTVQTQFVYVDPGNTLHVGVEMTSYHGHIAYEVKDINGKLITQGDLYGPSTKAYGVGVPVGKYQLTMRCVSTNLCGGNGWLND